MTRRRVADDQYGKLQRRLDEVARRVDEGPLDFQETMLRLQSVAENCLHESFQLFFHSRWKTDGLVVRGDYDYIHAFVNKVAPGLRVDPFELPDELTGFRIEFLQFDDSVTVDRILNTAKQKGLCRLLPIHVLLFGICHPTLQRYYDLHFIHEPLFEVRAEDLTKMPHRSPSGAAFTSDLPGRRYLVLSGETKEGGRRDLTMSPFYELANYGGPRQMFGFRRNLPGR